jgi:hypothetical protein
VGGSGGDFVAQTSGAINQATGSFFAVSSGITEKGKVNNTGNAVANAFSLQLNSNWFSNSPLCLGSSKPSNCTAWQQFLYLYDNNGSQSQIVMQYWVFGYGGTNCPSGFTYSPSTNGSLAGCFMNSPAADVPSLTASDLASVQLSGTAAPGGNDEVSMSVGSNAYATSASDSVLDLAGNWDQTEWGVYGDAGSAAADFTNPSGTSLEAQTSLVATSGRPTAPTCVSSAQVASSPNGSTGLTNETNNLNLAATPAPGIGTLPTMVSKQTSATGGTPSCADEPGYQPSPAYGLAADGLTNTWQAQSDRGSTGSPQPQPTTTGDCGNWSGGDGTQVVGLSNGENLWTFGDTFLGPAVARQDFFNNGFIQNSMVVQNGSAFTTITGGSGCASSKPTTATAPITSPSSVGGRLWPASSIIWGSDVVKFYYSVNSSLVQQYPEVAAIPQADLESGNTFSAQASVLSGCTTTNPIMWGTATISSGGYTYIYGSQQYNSGGDTGGNGGKLYLARTTGDPAAQDTWQYWTTTGWSPVEGCLGLVLAPLGGSEPIMVPTEFSVTSVNGDFWLVDQDPANGDQPGWAVAHEATTPTGFSNDPMAAVDLFDPGQTTFSGINDSVPGLVHYAVGMLEPSAVTPTQSGSVVIDYQVNDSYVDNGCISLLDYDANAYRPRFIDVPTSDLFTALNNPAALPKPAPTAASPGRPGKPATAAAGGRAAQPVQGTEPPTVSFSPEMTARGEAQLKAARAGSQAAAASTSWTYNPDTVPSSDGVTWSGSCPTSYPRITASDITFSQLPDGSVEVSWPNEGPDVWYWFHWKDNTSGANGSPAGTWFTDELWTQGPNADGYQPGQQAGTKVSTGTGGTFGFGTIYQVFTLPPGTNPGDSFSFWVQAFAAGNGNVTSGDTSADAASHTPTSPSETVSGLIATPGTNSVSLTWTAAPAPVEYQSIWYSVRFKPASSSTWTYNTDYIFNAADLTPLTGGTKYEFEVAVTDAATKVSTDANWSAPIYATPKT